VSIPEFAQLHQLLDVAQLISSGRTLCWSGQTRDVGAEFKNICCRSTLPLNLCISKYGETSGLKAGDSFPAQRCANAWVHLVLSPPRAIGSASARNRNRP